MNIAEKERFQEGGNTAANRARVDQLRKDLSEMREQLFREYPNYARAFNTDFRKDYNDLKANLSAEQSYLEYFTTATVSYAFVVDKTGDIQFLKLPGTKANLSETQNLEGAIQAIRSSLDSKNSAFLPAAHLVYQAYFQPLEAHIKHEELTIIPDGLLAYVSFDMLPTRLPSDLNNFFYHSFSDYLLQQKTISYQYSLSLDHTEKTERPANMKTFLGIAPSLEKKRVIRKTRFGPLVSNQLLVRALAKWYGESVEVWDISNREQFIEQAGDFRIIQLVSHALANDKQGDLSFLMLGPDETTVLDAKDVYASRLPNTELVILGSCEGAIGELKTGEGIISLARSFFYAGAGAVIPTLWSVEEMATEKITRLFHQGLIAGERKSVALRKAKLDYLDQLAKANDPTMEYQAHPYYWAGQIPVGNMASIDGLGKRNLGLYFLFIVLLAAVFGFFLKKNEKK